MSILQPYFCDRFTVEDYRIVARLRRAFNHNYGLRPPHFEPILMDPGGNGWSADQRYVIVSSGTYQERGFSCFDFRTARWRFAEEIYRRALESALARFPSLAEIHWTDLLPNWRELILPECFTDAGDFIMTEMERLTRSGVIAIETGCSLVVSPEDRWNSSEEKRTTLHMILDEGKITRDITKPIWRSTTQDYDLSAPKKTVVFEWGDITGFLYRPTSKELELINNEEARPPVRSLDVEMIDRIAHLDIEGALTLVDKGANINGADEYGATAITTIAESSATDCITFGDDFEARCAALPELKPSDRITMMKRLIEAGADVNFFYYNEFDVLIRSTIQAEPETVQFLLEEAGADPNHNTFPEDDPETISNALNYASTDAMIYEGAHREACEEIYQMLLKHGAVFRRNEEHNL